MGKVVVITGATAGVGRATARAFAGRGAAIGLLARGEEGLEATTKDVESAGGRAVPISTDVADPEAVHAAADRVEAELGPIDVWVNNAMTSVFAPFTEIEPAEFRRVTEVTYLGQVNGTHAALKRMLPRDRGVIVSVGSALGYRAIPLQSAYCGAKHAVEGFMESVRTELLHEGSRVKVTQVHMPALNTPQFEWVEARLPNHPQPVPPIFQPEIAAEAIVYASENPRRQLMVGGSTVMTILGNKVAPAILDRYLARTGYGSQQTEEPIDPNRPDNLWSPVEGDRGAHGRFDRRAKSRSFQLWVTMHRGILAAASAGAAALAVGVRKLARG